MFNSWKDDAILFCASVLSGSAGYARLQRGITKRGPRCERKEKEKEESIETKIIF